LLFIGAGILYWLVKAPPKNFSFKKAANTIFPASPLLLQITTSITSNQTLIKIALFFTKAGAFVFGSGLAIVPFYMVGL